MATQTPSTTMDDGVFARFQEIVYLQAGIALGPNKAALVRARVAKRMRSLGIDTFGAYLEALEADENGGELTLFLDAICTNVTQFFREPEHFEFMAHEMVRWLGQGQRRFRFWSAACSTGEEPFSLAMTLLEAARGYEGLDIRILATDLSTKALDACLQGCYSAERIKTVPPDLRERWFERIKVDGAVGYRARDELRDMVVFRRVNLSTPPFPMHGPLDSVLCRNAMIYFDVPVRMRLLEEVRRLLKPGGYLVVGHAESLTGMVPEFKYVSPAIYVRR
jgi:chemotaxis protein methyltransferase CheR